MLLYLVDTLERNRHRVTNECQTLLQAGQCLIRLERELGAAPNALSPAVVQRCYDAYNRHIALPDGIDTMEIPKRHLMFRMLAKLKYRGNSRLYGNWYDEALKRASRDACRDTSQVAFERSLLVRAPAILGNMKRKQ